MRYAFTTAAGLALDSIRAHKLRSFLTLLGIIIGVASVILVGAAIAGLGVYAESVTAKAFGSESFLIAQIASVGRLSGKQLAEKQRRNKRIRPEDIAYLESSTGDLNIYSAYAQRFDDVKGGNSVYEGATIIGSSNTLPDIREIELTEGRFFTELEHRSRAHVAVIGQDISNALFSGDDPIGKTIRVSGAEFRVVGLLERQGSSFGRSLDNPVYIPITVYATLYGVKNGISVFGKGRPASGLGMEDALGIARVALRTRFHAAPGEDDNFDTLTPDSVKAFIGQILGVISAVVVPVSAISLVVGGIVIMNIMLVSVTERTREIGIRKSLGANRREILLQFLTESVFLSVAGGVLGLGVGALVSLAASAILSATFRITFGYVFLSIAVSSVVGIISGLYPAWRASRLDPITALRAET